MSYVDGFVLAVPPENREKFMVNVKITDELFSELGATKVVTCWEDDVSDGDETDFRKAVKAKEGEIIVFSWVEWPSKEIRYKGIKRMQEMASTDWRFDETKNPVAFDNTKMIVGGFEVLQDY